MAVTLSSDLVDVLLDLVAISLCVGGLFWLGRWWCLLVTGFCRRRVVCLLGLRKFGKCFLVLVHQRLGVFEDRDSFCWFL